jgi:hypothetical protein
VDGKILRQPACLGEARLEVQVSAGDGTAQFAGHEDGVARPRSGAAQAFVLCHRSEQGD